MSQIDPDFTSPHERRDYWPFVRLILVVVALAVGIHWLRRNVQLPFLDPTPYLSGRQARNDDLMTFYLEGLAKHRRFEGRYPHSLVDAVEPTRVPGGIAAGIPLRDAWGHRVRYFSDGEIFLLVSVGRDGEAETDDYHLLRTDGVSERVCDDPDRDIVVSDRGWHQRCDPR